MKTDQIFIEPMASKSVAVVWSLLAISVQSSFSRPVQEFSKSRTIRSSPIFDDVQGYLTQFGYLPESDIETGNLRTEDQLHDALRTLQMFGNIPITGQMDAATKELLRKPRCGLPDVTPGQNQRRKRRYTLQGQKWQHTNLTWSLRTRHLERIDHGWVRADLHKAFQVWSRHSKLTFREVNSESADILVFFEKGFHGDGFPFDGPGQVLAHAFFPGSGRGGDAHFDEDEEWLLNGKETVNGTSLFMVAAHEFGHSLGLSHSSAQSALMFPWYQGHIKSDSELPEDDRFGIQILYGSKDDRIWGNIPVYRPLPNRPNTATTTTTTTSTTTTTAATTTTTTTTTTMTRAATTSTSPVVNAGTSKTRSPGVRIIPVVNDKPDYCNTSFDAVSIIRKDTFFFKGKYTWRLGTKNGLYPGYPALISRLWYDLPDNMTHVDAVYEKQDGNIVFFIGRRCYLFDGNILVSGYPKPLTALGLPEELDRVDAATVWGHNSKTYIFSGTMYWRYDDETERMELDYPRDMNIWRGVGDNINAAFQWHDGATYFLKGRDFWKFNDLRMRVDRADPRSVGQYWFNCTGADGVGDRIPNAGNKGGRVTVVRGKAAGRVGDEPIESGDGQTSNSSARSGGPPILSLLPFAVVFLRRRRPS